jgi:hypothetical protein
VNLCLEGTYRLLIFFLSVIIFFPFVVKVFLFSSVWFLKFSLNGSSSWVPPGFS